MMNDECFFIRPNHNSYSHNRKVSHVSFERLYGRSTVKAVFMHRNMKIGK